jgi:hypothetical protein
LIFESAHTIIHADLDWIKAQLKPEGSYIVFEHAAKADVPSIFAKESRVYTYLAQAQYPWQQVRNKALEREYLVIRIPPGNEEEILGKVLSAGLPKETVYYLYKAGEK